MPEIVFETLIANATPLPPGAYVQSSVIDVSGAREVNLAFNIPTLDAHVTWAIHFGPTTNNGYVQCRHGTFGSLSAQAISVPVFGTGMFLMVHNQGSTHWNVDGKVYFIRDLP
jgi:hypothetical protein